MAELIVASAPFGVLVYDATGQCRQANPGAATITGGTIDQLLHSNYRQLPSWNHSGLARMADEVLATGTPQSGEFHTVSTFGRPMSVACHFDRIAHNGSDHLLLVAHDVAEYVHVQEQFARHAAIIECSDDAIISKSLAGIITTWNRGAEQMFGFSAPEAINQHINIIIPAERREEASEILSLVQCGERVRQFDTVRQRKNGSTINVSITISPIHDSSGQVMGSTKIARDITERITLEKQFHQSQKMEALGRLAGGVAHDFNNLLTVIQGYSEMLFSETHEAHPMRDPLMEIIKAGERAASLTRQLLAYSRKQILVAEVCDLNALAQDCKNMLGRLLGEDIALTLVKAGDLGRVRVDARQLELALINLAINARDAMPRGGHLTIETANVTLDEAYSSIHPEVKPGEHVLLAVSDTGCGMEKATKARIFEPFFTTKEPGKGTGLGLAMVFGFTKQCGGHIAVYSEPGQGSTFKIYLRREDTESLAVPAPDAQLPLAGGATILLVEDEPDLRHLVRLMLMQSGYTVLEALNGGEALRVAEQHPGNIDLLITDVVMPVMGGRQLAEHLAVIRPGIKVLFMSGYTDDAVMRHGILSEENAFIQKPFTAATLPSKVQEVLTQ
jgi:PAS domain S-box-containing protein